MPNNLHYIPKTTNQNIHNDFPCCGDSPLSAFLLWKTVATFSSSASSGRCLRKYALTLSNPRPDEQLVSLMPPGVVVRWLSDTHGKPAIAISTFQGFNKFMSFEQVCLPEVKQVVIFWTNLSHFFLHSYHPLPWEQLHSYHHPSPLSFWPSQPYPWKWWLWGTALWATPAFFVLLHHEAQLKLRGHVLG